jgi:hypothetical protein
LRAVSVAAPVKLFSALRLTDTAIESPAATVPDCWLNTIVKSGGGVTVDW